MSNKKRENRKQIVILLWLSLLGLAGAILIGVVTAIPYVSPDLPSIDPSTAEWITFENQRQNYVLEYPDAYQVESTNGGDEVVFHLENSSLLVISHLTHGEADDRGLWADHQGVAEIELSGVAGTKYIYNHFDIIFGVHTISYVVPRGDKFLAIEFRMRRASILEELGLQAKPRQLGEIEQRILESFRFAGDDRPE